MTYQGFGYVVDSCPLNKTDFNTAATRLNCGVDKYGRSQYTCVPHQDMTALVEFCFRTTVGFYQKGHCLVTVGNGYLDQISCYQFQAGCPEENYRGSDLYKFSACSSINTEKQCFHANPSCPNTTRNDAMVGVLNTTMNSTKNMWTTEASTVDQESSHVGLITGSILGPLLILFLVLVLAVIFWRRRSRKRRSRRREYQAVPLENINKFEAVGPYDIWKTHISDQFSTLTDDEVSVLFCFLCSDSGPPDFTDTEWLDMLSEIRQRVYDKGNPVTSEKAQQTLDRLKSRDFLWADQTREHLTGDTQDEIMYRVSSRVVDVNVVFYLSSFITAKRYLRSYRYIRKPGQKCVIGYSYYGIYSDSSDSLLIRRLQMDILTHVTMEDTGIFDKVSEILIIPMDIVRGNKKEREEFIEKLKQTGEIVQYKGRSQDSVQHVTWLWRYRKHARPDIVRSCIGLHPHWDIYVINNVAYSKSNQYHTYSPDVRCLFYCLLLVDDYRLNINEESRKTVLHKIRDKYFTPLISPDEIKVDNLPEDIFQTQGNVITFKTTKIRHGVMYAFVTECLVKDSDLEFFLTVASRDVILEYCRTWGYARDKGERCLHIPEEMYDLFIERFQIDVIKGHTRMLSDLTFRRKIIDILNVPEEIIEWDQKARERYTEYAKRGTQTVHHARGMIVGCARAGKTTLLKRLLGQSEEEILKVTSTEGLEVHEEILEVYDGKLKVKVKKDEHDEKNDATEEDTAKTVSFFDFGGQCAYYACHQIYLTRRAFYIVVVDASKHMDQEVDKRACDQADTLFTGWTYKDYFQFWLKSIHTYCSQQNEKDENVDVMIVVTHWEDRISKDEKAFMDTLHNALPANSNLGQYIREDSMFYTQFPIKPLKILENFIVKLAMSRKWGEKIPHEWKFLNQEIEEKRMEKRILRFSDVSKRMPVTSFTKIESTKDMLRYYHDAGKVLYFNEEGLKESVIIDVQWFVDGFKSIITDVNHAKGIAAFKHEWDEYYKTGNLQSSLLRRIWEKQDEKLLKSLNKEKKIQKDDPCFLLHHEEVLLSYMQRLGLISIGETSHYVPCMNKRAFGDEQKNIIRNSSSKSSVLVFLFDFLPYFLFFRLVVKLMTLGIFEVLKDNDISCLYRNAALFSHKNHNIAVAVTPTTIQLQIFQPDSDLKFLKAVTLFLRKNVENVIEDITATFHKHLSYRIGYICDNEDDKILGNDVTHNFIDEEELKSEKKMTCPRHQMENRHKINPKYLQAYWKQSFEGCWK